MLTSVALLTLAVISIIRIQNTHTIIVTHLSPAHCPVTVQDVGSLSPVAHSQRVTGLIDGQGPHAACVA